MHFEWRFKCTPAIVPEGHWQMLQVPRTERTTMRLRILTIGLGVACLGMGIVFAGPPTAVRAEEPLSVNSAIYTTTDSTAAGLEVQPVRRRYYYGTGWGGYYPGYSYGWGGYNGWGMYSYGSPYSYGGWGNYVGYGGGYYAPTYASYYGGYPTGGYAMTSYPYTAGYAGYGYSYGTPAYSVGCGCGGW
jgi:hypothetical protein